MKSSQNHCCCYIAHHSRPIMWPPPKFFPPTPTLETRLSLLVSFSWKFCFTIQCTRSIFHIHTASAYIENKYMNMICLGVKTLLCFIVLIFLTLFCILRLAAVLFPIIYHFCRFVLWFFSSFEVHSLFVSVKLLFYPATMMSIFFLT